MTPLWSIWRQPDITNYSRKRKITTHWIYPLDSTRMIVKDLAHTSDPGRDDPAVCSHEWLNKSINMLKCQETAGGWRGMGMRYCLGDRVMLMTPGGDACGYGSTNLPDVSCWDCHWIWGGRNSHRQPSIMLKKTTFH